MQKESAAVGEGLRQVLWGELLGLVSLVASHVGCGLQIMPLVWLGNLVGAVSMGLVIVALAGLSAVCSGYHKALLCVAAELGFSIVSGFVPNQGKAVLVMLGALCASAYVRLVCRSTYEVALEQGEADCVRRGAVMWKAYAVGNILSALISAVFIYHTWLPAGRFPAMLAAPILQAAALFLYLHFLDRNQHILQGK